PSFRLAGAGPDARRRVGKVELIDAERPQRVDHGVGDAGDRADGPGLAHALDAERVARRRDRLVEQLHLPEHVRARHGVVHERAGEQLPARGLVDAVLDERLADTLQDAAVQLPLEQDMVDDAATVVDRDVAARAAPCDAVEREPTVPLPLNAGPAGSLARRTMLPASMPKISATISGYTVSWPCPDAPESANSVASPEAPNLIAASSFVM